MAEKIITFSGKQYSGKDTAAKILLDEMKDYIKSELPMDELRARLKGAKIL